MASKLDENQLRTVLEDANELFLITARVTKDNLTLFIDCGAAPDSERKTITVESLVKILSTITNQNLLDTRVLESIVEDFNKGKDAKLRRVAKGTEPVPGRKGKLLLLVKEYRQRDAKLEIIDQRFFRHFDNILPETVIGRIYPPRQGTDGLDVFGKAIPASEGKPYEVKFDKTIRYETAKGNHTYQTLIACSYGYLEAKQGQLSIKQELVINGNIDFRVGDIDFIGDVKIQGSVMEGFSVTARGSITIGENVEGGTISSQTGPIVVKGQIASHMDSDIDKRDHAQEQHDLSDKEQYQVRSGGEVKASLIMDASVDAVGNVEVSKEARGSVIRTRTILQTSRGHLLGGELYVVNGMEASIIGSDAEAKTEIYLCSDIESSVAFANIVRRIESHTNAESILKQYLGPYASNPQRIRLLNEGPRKKMEKLLQKLSNLQSSKDALIAQQQVMTSTARHHSAPQVNYQKALHQGVIIYAGDEVFSSNKRLNGPGTVKFLREEGTFALGEFEPLQSDLIQT